MSFEEKLDFEMLYRNLIDETTENMRLLGDYVPKWKKDLFIFLLMKSKEKRCPIKTKYLRKLVTRELNDVEIEE